ncbi:MAG: filamentous hemagglutinin N-terminal domain-containing protein [Moorea sp. SIO1F2]|nr:filamentous hemagglutinin N-terminal domain-containing protein [Moorena sp. SIO1F2]
MPATSVLLYSLLAATTALGQITPDNTLGNESSVVTNLNINGIVIDLIEGGAIRDSNLFHSFSDFNVAEFAGAYFDNPAGVANILSGVTGGNVSNIFGTLGVLVNANLFLINPNGIVFGPNSRLDVGGSFFGSTAESVLFEDGKVFSTKNPNEKPLLTINIPSGWQYGSNPGSITNQSSFFLVPNGETLGLIGGEVTIPNGALGALDGRIELGSVGSNGVVKLTPTDTSFVLDYSGVQGFQDISLSDRAFVITSGESGGSIQVQGANVSLRDRSDVFANTIGSENGGGIVVRASQLSLEDGSRIIANVFGLGQGGDLTVNASESVRVVGVSPNGTFSLLGALVFPGITGNGGDVSITTEELIVSDGAQVLAITFGLGDGGTLTVNADSTVQLIGTSADGQPSGLSSQTNGTGKAGDLKITTGELIVSDGARVSASTFREGNGGRLSVNASSTIQLIGRSANGQFASGLFAQVNPGSTGNAGNLSITTGELTVSDGARVSTATFGEGNGGTLSVDASSTVQVIGISADGQFASSLFAQANPGSTGNAGNLSVTTGQLMVSDGASVSASTSGEGNGGNLSVDASSTVQVIGTTADGQFPSALSTQTNPRSQGNAGNLSITTEQLIVSDGAVVSSETFGEGDGGSLSVNASSTVQVIGTTADGLFSGLFVEANREGTGDAGDLLSITTDKLIISDGAIVSARSFRQGTTAGTVNINANSIFLDNNSRITAETAGGNDSNIKLFSRDIRLLNRSLILTDAQNTTTGGNIEIDTDTLVGLGNSDITADAEEGRGGSVTINAKGIFGLEFRDRLTPDNDITATSELGPSFNGEVILNILQVDPTSGLNELPGILVAQLSSKKTG